VNRALDQWRIAFTVENGSSLTLCGSATP
jgi:hypothetical protein